MTATEQTKVTSDGDHSKVAVRVKALLAINQTHGKFQVLRDPKQPPYRAMLSRPEWVFHRQSDNILFITGSFVFTGAKTDAVDSEPQEADAIIRAEAVFQAVYELDPGAAFSDEDAMAFARINTHLNIYPFWREYVHDTLGRAGIAPFLIPPFNPFKASLKSKQSAPAQAAKSD